MIYENILKMFQKFNEFQWSEDKCLAGAAGDKNT